MIRSSCLFRFLKQPIKQSVVRSFKKQPLEGSLVLDDGMLKVSNIWKPVLFSVAFGGVAFAGCSIWQYESYVKNHTYININNLKDSLRNFQSKPLKRGHYRNEVNVYHVLRHK